MRTPRSGLPTVSPRLWRSLRTRRRRLLLSGAAALALVTGLVAPASAAPAASYHVSTVKLADGRRVVLRWNPCQVITYRVNVAAVPSSQRAAVLREVQTSVSRLASATRMTFRYRGTTTAVPRSNTVAGQNVELLIAVTRPGSTDFTIGNGVLGYGGYRYWQWSSRSSTGRVSAGAAIARGWVVIDVTGLFKERSGFGPGTTQGNVIMHELGHAVGLDHVSDRHQLLYPTLNSSAPNGYGPGDLAGLAKVGRGSGCISVPSSVVKDLN